jgi:hypothetical protein
MSEEYEEEMNGDENGATGPGAPTPVTALEVSTRLPVVFTNKTCANIIRGGACWSDEA